MMEKNPTHANAGPRLVYDAESPTGPPSAPPASSQRRWVLRVAVAAGLVIAAALALSEHQRAAVLEARVAELATALSSAQAEISARRQHLDAIRSSVAEMQQRVVALEALAGADPVQPPAAPEATPGH
ncbi:MAG TPA: hypothetical protein VFV62_09190 [Gaiellaceae bacterium]|nr:hypothetical protein [Gaiellaceae bacterium]